MATDWPLLAINEVAELVAMGPFGSSIKVETFVPSGVPIISGQHLRSFRLDESSGFNFISEEHADRLKKANVQAGDVIFTHAGNIGQVAYIPESSRYERYVISQRQFYMRCNQAAILPEFVVAYFKSPQGQHQLLANASQVGVPSIAQPVTYLRTIPVPVPPLREQHAITNILGFLDDKIELNRRMSETLEQIAQSIFHDWFVNFGPTRAKAAGRTPYLAQHLWQQFPNKLDSSDLPSGWERRTVGDFTTIRGGKQLKRELIAPRGHVPVFGGAGLMGYTENHNADGFVITVGRVGAYCGQFFHHRGPAWINNNASLITPRSDVSPEWFLHVLRNLDLNPIKKGAAQPFISNGDLSRLDVVYPGPTLISAFHDATSNLIKRAEAATRETATLVEVRDTLLPKLVSGELRVPQAERLVSEVV